MRHLRLARPALIPVDHLRAVSRPKVRTTQFSILMKNSFGFPSGTLDDKGFVSLSNTSPIKLDDCEVEVLLIKTQEMAEKTLLAFIGIILFFFDDGVVEKKKKKNARGKNATRS